MSLGFLLDGEDCFLNDAPELLCALLILAEKWKGETDGMRAGGRSGEAGD